MFKEEIIKILKKEKIPKDLLQAPPNPEMGDYALPCFSLAKEYKKAPQEIAKDLEKKLKPSKNIEKITANGPYLNFFINKAQYNKEIIEAKLNKKKPNKKTITLDFSQPNIMKPFNIAHLRSTMIGNALSKILTHEGYKVVKINHLGDWGTQFGKMIYAYEAWGNKTELMKDPMHYMTNLYVRFHKEAETDPNLEDKGREWFAKLEQGNKKARTYWELFSKLSLQYYNKTYKRLNVTFDSWAGEAFYEPMLKDTILLLQKKGIVKESEGALIVDLESYGITPCIIQKSDGSTIYATRDIAAAIYRAKTYKFYKNLYVVDVRQSLHFQQVFKTLELAGFPWIKDCVHIPFGTMKFEEGVMSTRKGIIIFLEDVLDKSVEAVEKIIEEKNPKLKDKKKVAEKVGIAAIVFWDLSHDRVKDSTFSWAKVLDFSGETGPYVQYTHARAASILRKAKSSKRIPAYEKLTHAAEKELIKQIALYEQAIEKSADQYKPSILAKYLMTLCQVFNDFYEKCPCNTEQDETLASARVYLVKKTKETLAQGLSLLGIQAPEEM
ncbi:MAG: arginyl-tRNA synthetase [archaeon GW2011_AR17]|nr:MAG: arginyl-tRNA synthetase [archaeon GW2011_AR17]MBS3154587.1 arginine--tRNA ligase [Candidatus Woesearchaeota archaeon]HIH14907.1 arginine--tRNA ligase [Nanoarchaeota archaeon]HIH58955.1 arginine--tRNA ligase [Nanoarchaeota archaeon]HII14218.1 arginine--tRNA ligase [Nanoarchaeota archaeon]